MSALSKARFLRDRDRVLLHLRAPADISGLVYFRIAFFAVMIWEAVRLIDRNWVTKYYSGKEIYFKYWPFTFVHPLSSEGMDHLLVAMVVVAAMAMVGLFYRLSAAIVFVMITYIFLIAQARYLNHIYLVCLIAFLMIFVPAHRAFSLDAWMRRSLRSATAASWSIDLLRFQVGIPYFFGGIAKINSDWLRGEPLREWLYDRMDFPVLGEYFENEFVVMTMAYGSLLLDLLAPFFLLHRRTRVFAFLITLTFHFMNSRLFSIGIFPWTMIAATILFFPSGWPRRLWDDLRRGHPIRSPAFAAGVVFGGFTGAFLPDRFEWMHILIGALGVGVLGYFLDEPWRRRASEEKPRNEKARGKESPAAAPPLGRRERWGFAALGLWVAIQVLAPLRHFVIPGNVHWTEEGHLFAWHMKLRDKSGRGHFLVTVPELGETYKVDPRDHLSSFQRRKMLTRPVMTVQFARYLEKVAREEDGVGDVEVRAVISVSLNGRTRQPIIDPDVDLTAVPYPWFGHADWLMPLTEPLELD